MKRMRRAVVVSLLALTVASPAHAQEAVEFEASIGLQGYVMPYSPSSVTVQVRADVLFVGNLQVTTGGVSLFTPVEVPAGSTKEYSLEIPSASSGRTTVRLFVDGDDTALASETLTALYPEANPLVGLVGADTFHESVTALESVPFGSPVKTLRLQPHELDADMAPLAYLVVGPGALDAISDDGKAAISSWVKSGGRLIGEARDVALVDMTSGETWSPSVTLSTVGSGEVITVADVTDVDQWADVVRDVPPPYLGDTERLGEMGWEFGFPMFEAASIGDGVTPGIPWLFGALLAYVLVVGPLNFFILRRFDRRELAWITIPALSIVMLAVLWVAGRSHVEGPNVTHASVIVQEAGSSRATSSMILVAGEGGEHSVDAPAGWSVAPFDASMMFGRVSGVEAKVSAGPDGGTRLSFDMPGLGAATLNARWQPEPVDVRGSVAVNDEILDISIDNGSPLEFWAWGVGYASSVSASTASLVPGETATQSLRMRNEWVGGMGIADAVMSRSGWDWEGEETWRKVWPLSQALSQLEPDALQSAPYFFGYTDDLTPEIEIDGRKQRARGPSLIVIPIESSLALIGESGVGEIIQIVGADFVDSYPGWVYAHGADALEVRFRMPPDTAGNVEMSRFEGHLPGVESFHVYNWSTGVFDEYEWLGEFPIAEHASPAGEVMVRIELEATEFNDLDLPTGAFALEEVTS